MLHTTAGPRKKKRKKKKIATFLQFAVLNANSFEINYRLKTKGAEE